MTWFRNHYRCHRCQAQWNDLWSCMCDDDCPYCGARHMSPCSSDDLTIIITQTRNGYFAVLRSPATAEAEPDYVEVAHFPTLEAAAAWRSP